jgi:hypothetical protein
VNRVVPPDPYSIYYKILDHNKSIKKQLKRAAFIGISDTRYYSCQLSGMYKVRTWIMRNYKDFWIPDLRKKRINRQEV